MFAVYDGAQQLLADTVRSLSPVVGVRNPQDLDAVDDTKVWAALADTGLLSLRRRENGTPVASGVEAAIVAYELGAVLSPAPYIASGILAVELLELAGVGDGWAEPISVGASRPGLLLDGSLLELADPAGREVNLLGRPPLDFALCLRRLERDFQLVRVDIDASFVTVSGADLTSPISARCVDAELNIQPLGDPIGRDEVMRWTALALTLVSADCAGLMRAALDGVVDYAKHRIAYGVPIGSFQALQHMCADAYVCCDAAVTTNNHAAWAVDALDPAAALLAARTAKAWTAGLAREVVETIMQLYGGIGHTWEHVAHLYTRRALFDAALFGDEKYQLDGITALRRARSFRSGD